jgi:hypothetical protein
VFYFGKQNVRDLKRSSGGSGGLGGLRRELRRERFAEDLEGVELGDAYFWEFFYTFSHFSLFSYLGDCGYFSSRSVWFISSSPVLGG